MTIAYYNSSYGQGFEGIINYVNTLTSGWFVNLFIIFIFIATTFTLAKSEWKMANVFAFSFFLIFITAMIFSLFTEVNNYITFVSIIGMGICVFVGIVTKNKD